VPKVPWIVVSLVRHGLTAFAVAFAVATLAFVAVRLAPGDLAYRIATARYGDGFTFKYAEELRVLAGLDQPLAMQYLRWIGSVFSGDFGRSIVSNRPVVDELLQGLGPTALVFGLGKGIALLASLLIGTAAGLRPDGFFDRTCLTVSAAISSIPPYLIGMVLILVFAIRLQWLPASGSSMSGYAILPAVTLAIATTPDLARVVRNSVVRTAGDFYITYGRIKGQSWARIMAFHALRPTLVPVVAYFGPSVANLLGGLIVVDVLFNLDGIGSQFVDSVLAADVPMALGSGLVLGLFVVLVNGATDILMKLLDPREFSPELRA
jgi:peptide/nickel transport system permease protein